MKNVNLHIGTCVNMLMRVFTFRPNSNNYWAELTSFALSCFFRKHLLSCFFEVWTAFIVELLFCVGCSSLSLCILEGLLVLILISCRSLLHTHHCTSVTALACVVCYATHASVHSWVHSSCWSCCCEPTFSGNNWRLSCCLLLCLLLNFWFLSNNVQHTILECFFILA